MPMLILAPTLLSPLNEKPYKETHSYSPANQAVGWALLSEKLFGEKLPAGVLVEGFALVFGAKVVAKTYNI